MFIGADYAVSNADSNTFRVQFGDARILNMQYFDGGAVPYTNMSGDLYLDGTFRAGQDATHARIVHGRSGNEVFSAMTGYVKEGEQGYSGDQTSTVSVNGYQDNVLVNPDELEDYDAVGALGTVTVHRLQDLGNGPELVEDTQEACTQGHVQSAAWWSLEGENYPSTFSGRMVRFSGLTGPTFWSLPVMRSLRRSETYGNVYFERARAPAACFKTYDNPNEAQDAYNPDYYDESTLATIWPEAQGGLQCEVTANFAGNVFAGNVFAGNVFADVFAGNVAVAGASTFAGNVAVAGWLSAGAGGNLALGSNARMSNSTGTSNCAAGDAAMTNNTSGSGNSAFGALALTSNGTGTNNCAVGRSAMRDNASGSYNVAVGYHALMGNATGSQNVAAGDSAMVCNTTGSNNVALGHQSLFRNVDGAFNACVGLNCGYNTTGGTSNAALGAYALNGQAGAAPVSCTAIGGNSLFNVSTASNNTAVGTRSMYLHTASGLNSALGYQALGDSTSAQYSNCTGAGANARVTNNNQVQLGDSTTSTYAYGAVQNRSDARDKADVRDTTLGLGFLERLRPVDYRWDLREDYGAGAPRDGSRKRARFHHGLIAQEVKAVADELGADFGGLQWHAHDGEGQDVYTLGYDELVAPLVKAVQELAADKRALDARVAALEARVAALERA